MEYHSARDKQLGGIRWAVKNAPGYDWYFFADDDSCVHVTRLRTKLLSFDKQALVHYGKTGRSYEQDPTLEYCSGGYGSVMSWKVLQMIEPLCDKNMQRNDHHFADVTVGEMCRELGIERRNHEDWTFVKHGGHIQKDPEIMRGLCDGSIPWEKETRLKGVAEE